MIYVTSDIHGDYIHFSQMTEKIGLSSEDMLYILGDAVDKGKENLWVLRYIYCSENICLIKGNHEYLCERYLTGTISGNIWDACGGKEHPGRSGWSDYGRTYETSGLSQRTSHI